MGLFGAIGRRLSKKSAFNKSWEEHELGETLKTAGALSSDVDTIKGRLYKDWKKQRATGKNGNSSGKSNVDDYLGEIKGRLRGESGDIPDDLNDRIKGVLKDTSIANRWRDAEGFSGDIQRAEAAAQEVRAREEAQKAAQAQQTAQQGGGGGSQAPTAQQPTNGGSQTPTTQQPANGGSQAPTPPQQTPVPPQQAPQSPSTGSGSTDTTKTVQTTQTKAADTPPPANFKEALDRVEKGRANDKMKERLMASKKNLDERIKDAKNDEEKIQNIMKDYGVEGYKEGMRGEDLNNVIDDAFKQKAIDGPSAIDYFNGYHGPGLTMAATGGAGVLSFMNSKGQMSNSQLYSDPFA